MQAVRLGLHQSRGDGSVVEDAVAAALVGRGVVGAARQVGGHAAFQRRPCRSDGGSDRTTRPLHHRLAPREADLALQRCAERAFGHRAHVSRRVRERQFTLRSRQGRTQLHARQFNQPLAQQPVLRHREAMARRQRQNELIGVEGLHRGVGLDCAGRGHCGPQEHRC